MKNKFDTESNSFLYIFPVIVIVIGLYMTSQYNYLIFHTVTEFFSIVIAWSIFILIWNTRENIDNEAYLFLGIAYLFIGCFDFTHALSYKGMSVLGVDQGANPATQLWIVARYMESISLCLFPLLFYKRINFLFVFGSFTMVTALALLSIFFLEIFPVCFIEGVGLTPFKKSSEYIICILLATALFLIYQKRHVLDQTVYKLMLISIGMTIMGELAFTFYVNVYGLSNLIGHLFKIFSFFLIYKAVVYTGLKKPHDLMFKELSEKGYRYRQMFETNQAVKLIINPESGSIVEANEAACNFYGYSKQEITSLFISDINVFSPEQVAAEMDKAKSENNLVFNFPHRLSSGEIREVEVYSGPIKFGETTLLYSIIQDITERKQAEQAIQTQAENLSIIFNNAPYILALVNDEGRVEMLNDKGAVFWGKEKKTTLGLLSGEVFNCLNSFDGKGCGKNIDCGVCPVRMRIMSTFDTKKAHVEEEGKMTFLIDGKERSFDFLISTSLLRLNNSNKVLLSLADITERKKSDNALVESEEKFRLAFQISPDSININRVETGVYMETNDGFTQIMGYEREEVIGKSSIELGIWKNSYDRTRLIHGLEQDGYVKNLEAQFVAKNGDIVYGLMSASIIAVNGESMIISITRDITERKQMEEERERFLAAIEQAAEGIVITNVKGTIQYVNPAFETITGHLKKELIGQNPRMLKSHRHDELFYRQMWNEITSGHTWKGRLINKKKDGTLYTEETTISPVIGNFEKIINFVAVKRDVTDEIEMEERLKQSQKMEAIGTLAGGIAHDFNNILFPIVGYTEMLLEDFSKDSTVRDSLNEIYTGALRARNLVQQILAFSRQKTTDLKLMKMQPIIKEALKLLRSTIPATISINQNIQPNCGAVEADPTQIHQIVMNLTTNAYHAMEETGGELRVTLLEIKLNKDDLINPDMIPGRYACLSVADTGKGIDKEVVDRIFEPFFTTKKEGKGTGLGLSVVHGIAQSMNGAVKVESVPDGGTRFHVYLPIIKNIHKQKKSHTKSTLPGGDERVLLVDDEEGITTMVKLALERLGYRVTSRTTGVDALAVFKAAPDKFDLVITDMAMPKLPGDKFAVELIKIRPDLPIIMCTGFSETMTEQKIKSLGIKGLLLKPVVIKQLAEKVREVLDRSKK